jgi:hypothetical protein
MCRAHSGVMSSCCYRSTHEYRVARSAMETHPVWGGPAPPLRPPSCWRPPSWPAQPERTAELQSPTRGRPPPRILGVRKCPKNPFEIMGASNAHRNLVREMGPECWCAVRNATATRVGVRVARGVQNLLVKPTADRDAPRGRAARDGEERRRTGVRCACTGRRNGALSMRLWRMRRAPFGPVRRPGWTRGAFVWQVAVPQGPRRLMEEAASAHLVGVGRRQLLRVPKQCDWTDWRAVGAKKCGIKRGSRGGTSGGRALIGTTIACSATNGA